ncbi:PASTA domain-containing protein [Deinococcus peraridilitoris]|uniref:PASTA domain-containing protein n=1 Tax=Deinococcus peraridilitoris (strain DSM 19664 / LMG 22246 / CIP 109416 / KR-200) TaxID=937777 RepID=L0A5S8_DEIPD|nr:PASTA domain-containing protein [Deinococcus peraridilitoris]AFZ68375.1 hypothetical protein Deipe_2914 [Deinococcus peraridilitoris DSM 19664]
MARIDGKYEELRELERSGAETLLEVTTVPTAAEPGTTQGELLRLGWFDVSTPSARADFHRYRSALKVLAPLGLIDVVARPGAYYSLWRPLEGTPLGDLLQAPSRDPDTVDAVRELAAALSEQGYALSDAEIVVREGKPHIARLAPVNRTPEEAAALNAQTLQTLAGGRLRRRSRPKARRRLTILGILPGLLCLAGAAYLAPRAAQIYLNPPVHSVPDVMGQEPQSAAKTLVEQGYRVAFADGESDSEKLGSVIGQSPKQGSSLNAGRLVTLTVNNPPPLTVPKVEELTLAQARAALNEVRLRVGAVLTVDGGATDTPKGRVIAQVPEAGATIARGQQVRLLVSGGVTPQQTWLPDLRGLSAEDARDLVRKAGLVVTKFETQTSGAPENSVLAQSPAPYQKVGVGTAVVLTIARAPVANPVEAVPSLPLAPAPAQPEPVQPEPPAPEPPAALPDEPALPQPSPEPSPAEQTPPAQASPPPPVNAPGEGSAAETAAKRTVQISYTFPADLPSGNVEIFVRDADGERVVLGAQPTATVAGNRAEGPVEVRGEARFSVRVDGQEIDSFIR